MPSPGHFAVRRGRASAPIVIFSRVLSFPEARFMLWCILVGFGACLRLEPRGIKGCAKSLSNFLTFIALAVWLALPRRSPSWTALTGASLSMTIGNRRRPTANAIRANILLLKIRKPGKMGFMSALDRNLRSVDNGLESRDCQQTLREGWIRLSAIPS